MNLTLNSWNGHAINDGVNYSAIVVPGSMANLTLEPVYSERAEGFPFLSGAVLPPHAYTIKVTIGSGATIATLREQLKSWFFPLDFIPHQLIATDENTKQWQLTGYPIRLTIDPNVTADTVYLITIGVQDPIWRSVTVNSDTWNITATAQQRVIAAAGNIFALPKFTITPTNARTSQWQYLRWSPVYNRVNAQLFTYPIDMTNGGLNTLALINDTTVSNQINNVAGIDAVQTTIPIDTPVGGGLATTGGMALIGSEQVSYTSISGGNMLGVVRGIGGTTAAVHADNVVVARSKMQANGADIRVMVDGAAVNFWLSGINTTTTKIWISPTWSVKQQGTLLTALPNNGTAVTVSFTKNSGNLNLLTALKTASNSVFLIDNEAFTYSPGNVNLVTYQIANCSRAQKYTSFAAHSANAAIRWIEHDIWLIYGNQSAAAADVDDTYKPLLNLSTSTNTSWVFANFYDSTAARPGSWYPAILSSAGQQSDVFTGNQGALANPATELGMMMLNYQLANVWKAETATLIWSFYHPIGITTVSMSGSKYLFTLGTWPNIAGLQKLSSGNIWTTVWTEAVPGTAATWTAFTRNGVALSGTYNSIRVALSGTIAAAANNAAEIQADTITLALDSTLTPVVALNSEQTAATFYYISCTITNVTTGDSFTLTFPMALSQTIIVDCVNKTVVLGDGTNAASALITSTVRNNWLTLAVGNNTLQYDDVGTAGVTIVTTYNDRTL